MIEWKKYPDEKPICIGPLLVVINDQIMLAEVCEGSEFNYKNNDKDIVFLLHNDYEFLENNIMMKQVVGGEWIKPKLYADISYWMYLPQLPQPPND